MGLRAGSKIKLIDDSGLVPRFGETMPLKGKVYTIRDTVTRSGKSRCFRLKEIVNKPQQYAQGFIECSFRDNRFVRN